MSKKQEFIEYVKERVDWTDASENVKIYWEAFISKEEKEKHNGKDFMCDVSTKTIEDICQLLQCQPQDLIDWKVDLKPELAYENRFKE